MAIIRIKSTTKLSDMDALYGQLSEAIASSDDIDVQLPKSIARNFFGITSGLIQFIASWLQYSNARNLYIDIDPADIESINVMYEEEFFFPIIALAWNDVTILNLEGLRLRPILRDYQNDFTRKMRKIQSMKGEKMLLVNLDHFTNSTGLLPLFEDAKSFTITEEELRNSLRTPILSEILKLNRSSRDDFATVYDDMIGIVYELMKNTYEWGRKDKFGVPISPSVRGVYIRFFKKNRTKLIEEYSAENVINKYFKFDRIKNNHLNQVYFIEISVFDSGKGFIDMFVNDTDEPLNDVEIIKKCLIKNQTSSISFLKADKGIGLDRILSILNKKGLFRIRTDKYCLYRDLIENPYEEIGKENFRQMQLLDWNSQSDQFSNLFKASGSNISILYPLPNTSY